MGVLNYNLRDFYNTDRWEYPVKTRDSVEDEKIASIAESVANNILGNFFREITDENLKVDVDALQAYIDNFMKSAS